MQRLVSILMILFIGLGVLAVKACKKTGTGESNKPATPITFTVPPGWPQPAYNLAGNPITQEGFELGRKLFYDGRLSKDGNFPCASCHQQFAAFATFDHNFSHGFNNTFTTRNAQGLYNLAWRSNFMYDGGITHLDLQPLAPITATNEMAESIDNVLQKLRADAMYRQMFTAAFGDPTINTQRMTQALSQFMLMMVSSNSRYDRMKRGQYDFNLPEELGYNIFKAKCASCHTEPFFSDFSFRNTGLPVDPTINDWGRMVITRNPADSLKFQVPSLRNVQVTFPYGHDGRFVTLDQVMDHYRSGVVNGPTTDPLVKNKIPLSNFEIGQLKAFLYTLTDSTFMADKRFSQP